MTCLCASDLGTISVLTTPPIMGYDRLILSNHPTGSHIAIKLQRIINFAK